MLNLFQNIKSLFIVVLSILIYSNVSYAQLLNEEVLVKIGDNFITKSEFENRLNFVPRKGIQDKSSFQGIKNELLYTLIAEKLWANHAIELGYQSNPYVFTALNVIEKMFVRDELYRREIKEKKNYKDEDLELAKERDSKNIEVVIFFSPEKENIEKLKTIIEQDSNFEKVLLRIDSNLISSKPLVITYGDLEKRIENEVYRLELNQFSNIIEINNVWNIVYIKNIVQKEYDTVKDQRASLKKIEKILKRRQENINYQLFHNSFFSNKKVNADGKLFKIISRSLENLFEDKKEKGLFSKNDKDENVFVLDSQDLRIIEKEMGKEIFNKRFLIFNNNPITVETFLREISFLSFNVIDPNYEVIKVRLNKKVRDYIKHELLAREGFKKGLDQSQNVRRWVRIWYENFLYQAVKSDFLKNTNLGNSTINQNYSVEELENEKLNDRFNLFIDSTIKLSENNNIEINEEMFNNIKQGNINLFVLRHLGFGGTIAGVPSSPPFMEWYVRKKKLTPQNL